jgi:hypothetical protein
MDIDREIQNLKKLIANAEGDNLTYLVERLHTLVKKREAEKRLKESQNQEEYNQEKDIEPPSLLIKEKDKSVKIVGIDQNILKNLYIKFDGVTDFINKCVEYAIEKFTKDESVSNLIKSKLYLQLKITIEYSQDKPYQQHSKLSRNHSMLIR